MRLSLSFADAVRMVLFCFADWFDSPICFHMEELPIYEDGPIRTAFGAMTGFHDCFWPQSGFGTWAIA
jgi:hypothetical protein